MMGGELSDDLDLAWKEFKTDDKAQGLFLFTEAFRKSFTREQRKAKERKKKAENAQDHHHPALKTVDSSEAGS